VKNNSTFLLLFILICSLMQAQTSIGRILKGNVFSNQIPLEGITVTNATSKISVVTDVDGVFLITVNEGDVLSFSSVNYEMLRKYIAKKEFAQGTIIVELTPKNIQLNEVVVNKHPKITAENLGIIPKDQIKLTTAERRLQTAGDFKPVHLLGLLGGYLAVDPILNAINGRTKMLKTAVAVEKKELLMAKLEVLFEEKYYLETLKIPEEYIKGFQYYCVENNDFVRSLKEKNKTMCMFLITNLALVYNNKRMDIGEGN
jgi:hypothetical protein